MRLLLFAFFLLAAQPAFAQDLTVRAGVPAFLSFYGRSPEPGESTLQFLGRVGVDVTAPVGPAKIGGSIDGGLILGELSGVDGHVYAVAIGPTAFLATEYWLPSRFVVGAGLTPGILFYGARADAALKKNSVSVGLSGEVSAQFRVMDRGFVGLFAELGLYREPLTDGLWFNERLGATNILNLDLAFVYRFGKAEPHSGGPTR